MRTGTDGGDRARDRGPDGDAVERLLAAYLETVQIAGSAAGEGLLGEPEQREEVLRRVAELRRLGFELPAGSPDGRANGDGGTAGAADAPPAPSLPLPLGAYDLLELLGRGGMGAVYRAVHRQLRRKAAVKCLVHRLAGDPEAPRRFRREVRALAELHHEGIVGILDVGSDDGLTWYAMELVEGPSFDRLLQLRIAMPDAAVPDVLVAAGLPAEVAGRWRNCRWPDLCLQLARDAAAALGHAHRSGVVHRDVKPANLMLRADGRVVVVDFGLAVRGSDDPLTRAGQFVGSPLYAAPEHLTGSAGFAAPTLDVWSLGVVLCELLTCAHPFRSASGFAAQRHAVAGNPKPWHRRLAGLPYDVATVCLLAIDQDSRRRYRDGAALAADLDRLLTGRPITGRRAPWHVRGMRWLRRRPLLAAAVAAVLFAAGVAGWATAAGVREAARQQRIVADTTQWMASLVARGVPSLSSGQPLPLLQAIRETRQELGHVDVLPEVRANVLHRLGDFARELSDLELAEECLQECVALRRATGAGPAELGRALASLGLVLIPRRSLDAPAVCADALRELERAPEVSARELLQLRLEQCRALYEVPPRRETYRLVEELLEDLPADRADLREVRADALAWYGMLLALNERIEKGRPLLDEAHALLGSPAPATPVAVRVAACEAAWRRRAGDLEGSSAVFDGAVAMAVAAYGGGEHVAALSIRRERAFLWRRLGRLAEAERELRDIEEGMEHLVHPLHPARIDTVLVLGKVLRELGRHGEAVVWFERRLALHRARWQRLRPGLVTDQADAAPLRDLAEARAEAGDLLGAERDVRSSIRCALLDDREQQRNIERGESCRVLGEMLARQGRFAEAEGEFRQAVECLLWAVHCVPERYLAAVDAWLGFLREQGREGEVAGWCATEVARLEARRAWIDAVPPEERFLEQIRGCYLGVLGEMQLRAGLGARAVVSFGAALPHLLRSYGRTHPYTRRAQGGVESAGSGR